MNLTDLDKDQSGVASAFINGFNNNTADAIDYLINSNINNFLEISYIKPLLDKYGFVPSLSPV